MNVYMCLQYNMFVGLRLLFATAIICMDEAAAEPEQNKECLLQFKSPLNAKVSCAKGIEGCRFARLELEFPHLFNKSVWRAPAPAMISLEAFCTDDSEHLGAAARTNQPAVQLVWKLPVDSGAERIRGFDIRVEGHIRGYKCFVVDLLEPVTATTGKTFSGTIPFEDHRKSYVITVQSLPVNNASGALEKIIKTPNCEPSPSGSWSVKDRDVNLTYIAGNQQLLFTFKGPPKRFGFEHYKVSIISDDYSTYKQFQINQTKHLFTDIEPGKYEINLEPYDPDPWPRCKCRNTRDQCSPCTLSEIHYIARPKAVNTVDSALPLEVYIVSGISCGLLILALIAIVFVHKVFKRQGKTCFPPRRVTASFPVTDEESNQNGLVVFINADQVSNALPRNKQKEIQLFLRKYKEKLRKDTCVHIAKEEVVMCENRNLDVDIQQVISSCSSSFSVKSDTVSKYNHCIDDAYCNQVCLLPRGMNVLCCFIVSDKITKDTIERIKTIKLHTDFLHKDSFIKIVLNINQNPLKLSANDDIVCYNIPKQYESFVQHVNQTTVKSHCSSNSFGIDSATTNNIRITVDLDKQSIDGIEDSDNALCQNHARAGPHVRLDVPRPVRERYVSNDSGRGGSVDSYRCSQAEENIEGYQSSDDRDNGFVPNINHGRCMNHNYDNGENTYPYLCPTNFHFFPPEPSEISESDILESYQGSYTVLPSVPMSEVPEDSVPEYNTTQHRGKPVKSINNNNTFHSRDSMQSSSMDNIMSKMAALNARSLYIIEHEAKPDETYSLFDGNA